MKSRVLALVLALSLAVPFTGCTNMTKTQQGMLSGGAIGAGASAGIAALAGGHVGVAAAIGGLVGGAVGGIYGHDQEKKNVR